jgi:hypothetical protein
MRDLLVPALARTASIFFNTSAVCPFMSKDLSSATVPDKKTRSPKTAALQFPFTWIDALNFHFLLLRQGRPPVAPAHSSFCYGLF